MRFDFYDTFGVIVVPRGALLFKPVSGGVLGLDLKDVVWCFPYWAYASEFGRRPCFYANVPHSRSSYGTFRLLHDMAGRIALYPTERAYLADLCRFFGYGQPPVVQPTVPGDREAMARGHALNRFEGYNNEPDVETPYGYLYAGRHDRCAEVVRAGIQAVSKGQLEAAQALGLSRGEVLRLVILPHALRIIIPPMISQYLNLTKNSSLAPLAAYGEIFLIST